MINLYNKNIKLKNKNINHNFLSIYNDINIITIIMNIICGL